MLVNMPRRISATMNSTKEEEEEEEEGQVSENRKPAGFFGCMLPDTDGRLSRPPHIDKALTCVTWSMLTRLVLL